MKVIILTSYSTKNIYKVNYLIERLNVVGKVIEKRPRPVSLREKVNIRKRMIRRHGLIKTVNKLLYNKYRSLIINRQNEDTIRNTLFPDGADVEYSKDIPTIEVSNINEQSCIDFIKEHDPDVIAVCGTTVLKPQVFKLAKKGTINIHSGIVPEYRSADPFFWALYNNEPDKVGVTIHFVDEGIDTGPIIYQSAVGVTKDDTIATLVCKCNIIGAELMVRAIEDIERGEVKILKREDIQGRAFYHINLGILQYCIFLWRFRKLKNNL